MNNTYLVTLWKFDEHHYKETELLLRYDPSCIDNPKPTLLQIINKAWMEWRNK